ncbi:hypothetical protein VP01_585g1 [Puccinia sorghi]|uniref:Uncharacterized protein n=1 Tax=Puccinia sorghi TaxID=27349 RepID=A0A0L6UIQ9_9BASI|nr:hypothetical protein VP01_585g1 [Puccinia sorghi]
MFQEKKIFFRWKSHESGLVFLSTLLANHLVLFQQNYTALTTSIIANPGFMTVLTGLAAALFFQSCHQHESLIPLIQNLHDIKPLSFEKVYDRLRKLGKKVQIQNHCGTKPSSTHCGVGSSRGFRARCAGRERFCRMTPTRPAPRKDNDEERIELFNRRKRSTQILLKMKEMWLTILKKLTWTITFYLVILPTII